MSTAYHPETDRSSEQSNKTINQCVHFHVQRNQQGWVKALPKVRFDIMNTTNASTGFSPFQLRTGQSSRIIPPLMDHHNMPMDIRMPEGEPAQEVIKQIQLDIAESKDCLLAAKVSQADAANRHQGKEDVFVVGDQFMLSTLHRRQEYKSKHQKRAAKFFPRFNGLYKITKAHLGFSTYILHLPNSLRSTPLN
jgi:hypothetical protein